MKLKEEGTLNFEKIEGKTFRGKKFLVLKVF
jgi:hypothetical protein